MDQINSQDHQLQNLYHRQKEIEEIEKKSVSNEISPSSEDDDDDDNENFHDNNKTSSNNNNFDQFSAFSLRKGEEEEEDEKGEQDQQFSYSHSIFFSIDNDNKEQQQQQQQQEKNYQREREEEELQKTPSKIIQHPIEIIPTPKEPEIPIQIEREEASTLSETKINTQLDPEQNGTTSIKLDDGSTIQIPSPPPLPSALPVFNYKDFVTSGAGDLNDYNSRIPPTTHQSLPNETIAANRIETDETKKNLKPNQLVNSLPSEIFQLIFDFIDRNDIHLLNNIYSVRKRLRE